jgi:hypothetical protein
MAEPLEPNLEALQLRLERARARLTESRRRAGSDEWQAAHENQLKAERELAAAQGLDYAETFNCEFPWDIGAPLPRVVAGKRVFLAFYVNTFYLKRDSASGSDSARVTITTPPTAEPVGVVEFVSCAAFKMGGPNDEAFHRHPLYGRGLEAYRAHVERRSLWITEVGRINSGHPEHRPGWHERLTHYIFAFHDETFECIAKGYQAEVRAKSMGDVLLDLASLVADS